jgi:hypothetical protein
MGVVFLLVALPGVAVIALMLSVFGGIPALALSAMLVFAIGCLVYASREWDDPAASKRT